MVLLLDPNGLIVNDSVWEIVNDSVWEIVNDSVWEVVNDSVWEVVKVHLTSNLFIFYEIGKIVILENFWRKNFSNLINSLPVSYGETLSVSGSRPCHGSLGE